jgi:hypothetical protein
MARRKIGTMGFFTLRLETEVTEKGRYAEARAQHGARAGDAKSAADVVVKGVGWFRLGY